MGTGVFYDSGNYLYWGGPVSLLLSYLIMWSVLFSVMVRSQLRCDANGVKMSLREIITSFPIPGAVFSMANRVLCPAIVRSYESSQLIL
jgi:amino acid permease